MEWPFTGRWGQVSFHLFFGTAHLTAVFHHYLSALKELFREEEDRCA